MATSGCSSSVLSVMADQSGTPIKSDTSSTATLLLTWSSLGLVVERSLHVCAGWYVCRFPLALALALGMLASILTHVAYLILSIS